MAHTPINLIGHTNVVMATVFTPDGRRLVSGGWDETIKVWNVEHATEEATLRGHTNSVWSLATSGDGLLLASGSGDFTVKLWSLSSLTEVRTFQGHTEGVYSVALSADGTVLVSASSDRTVRIWDPTSGAEVARLDHPYPVRCLALTPDGKLLITSCDQKFIGSPPTSYLTFWDVATRSQVGSAIGAVVRWSLALTADGTRLAVGFTEGDFDSNPPHLRSMVELWDVARQRSEVSWEAHTNEVTSLSFTRDARRLATGSFDTTVKLWNVTNQQLEDTFADQRYWVHSVAITGDGKWLASGGGQSPSIAELHLWDLTSKRGCRSSASKEKGVAIEWH
jgi:WD40 repeat protein